MRTTHFALGLLLAVLVTGALGTATAARDSPPALPSLDGDRLLRIAEVSPPPGGVLLEIHADFPADDPLTIGKQTFTAITATVNNDGDVQIKNAIEATGVARGAEAEECTDPTFLPLGPTWKAEDMPVVWYFRAGSTPPENSIHRTQLALRRAHGVWPTTQSHCTDADRIDFAYSFGGALPRSIDYDGYNSVEFGPLGEGALAVNYTWYLRGRILETDLRLNRTDYNWTNMPGGVRYQVVNVVAHELGHQLGLDDLGSPHAGQTMFGRIDRGEIKKTTLGAGDLNGARRVSP